MLFRKMLREFKSNFGTFFSVFLLAALAMALFVTFEGHVLSQNVARDKFHDDCNLSDVWMYGEGFTTSDLGKVTGLDFVEAAGLRMSVTGSAPDCDGVQVDLYLENENVVNTPYLIDGEPFNPTDKEGLWISNAFAERRDIKLGDDFTIEYNGVKFTKKVKGLIESAEYEFRQADSDADTNLANIAIVYMSYDGFPTRDYIIHLVNQGKINADVIAKNAANYKELTDKLDEMGVDIASLDKDMLLTLVDKMSDEQLMRMMPYTQMIIRTKDGGALKHEDEIAESIDNKYSAMIDRSSVPGLARLDSELDQHQTFSYAFVLIFVGIAVLVIATSMKRMVEKQRTQIGTLNALGMKRGKILFHYISFSLFISLLGVIVGLLLGIFWLCPLMMNLFAEWYVVPGLHSVFQPIYFAIAAAIVIICVLSDFLSCKKVLKVKPAEALRPAPPKQGKSCIFEKLPFWNKLKFNSQYNLRDISRAKLRAFMSVIGTAVGMLLMIYGVGCNELVSTLEDVMFEKSTVSEYQVKLSQDAPIANVNALNKELDGELVMIDQIEVSKVKNPSIDEKKKQTITVVEGKGLYNILDVDNNIMQLKPGSIAVSRKLSKTININVGDTIYWHLYMKNTWYEAKVGAIYRDSTTQGIAYLREDYEKTGAEYTPSLLMTNKDASDKESISFVTGVNGKQEMKDAYEKSMEVMSMMVIMMVLFSVILVVTVLYNSGSLSFNERVKEFATLKVLGLKSSKIRGLLSIQNLWLSIIGIIIGAPLGNVTLNAMFNSNGENFDYHLVLPAHDYIIAGILVLVISVLVSFMFSKRIKKLDMIEVLKGVE